VWEASGSNEKNGDERRGKRVEGSVSAGQSKGFKEGLQVGCKRMWKKKGGPKKGSDRKGRKGDEARERGQCWTGTTPRPGSVAPMVVPASVVSVAKK
jgi:hypothetical protein